MSPTGIPLAEQLAGVETAAALAIVDDTIFSGITMRCVLQTLAPAVRARAHAFCLRCVAESLPPLRALCPVTPGFAAPGHILDDVSFINASGLVRRGAIRRTGQSPLAFFERPEWIQRLVPGPRRRRPRPLPPPQRPPRADRRALAPRNRLGLCPVRSCAAGARGGRRGDRAP